MKYCKVALPYGAKLYYCKNNISKITTTEVAFECGARAESIPGLAHFVEHMFFAGTKKLKKDEVIKEYYDFIDVNAYTNYSNIFFSGRVFTSEFDKYLATIAMLINESNFSKKAIEEEKKVITQEILLDTDNEGYKAHRFNSANLTLDPINKIGIVGTKESVNSITQKDVKEFVKKYFVAQNLDIYVSSPLSVHKIKQIVIKNLLNKLPQSKDFKKLPNVWSHNVKCDNFFKIQTKKMDKCYICINFKIDRTDFDHKFKRQFYIVASILNDVSEGVTKKLRIDKSLVYSAYVSNSFNDKNSFVVFETECQNENAVDVVKTFFAYIKEVCANGFTEAQLKKAKRTLKYSIHAKEPHIARYFYKLYDFKLYNKVIKTNWLNKVASETTLKDCNDILKEVFINNHVSLSVYGGVDKKDFMTKKDFDNLVDDLVNN